MSDVTIYYLEMADISCHQLVPVPSGLTITEACVKQYQVNRLCYELVGAAWQWNDKADWTDAMWRDYAESDSLRTWLAYHQGSIAGYFELKQHDDQSNELAYFGLGEKFIGKGFGGALLSASVTQAWNWGSPQRVIVNTCSLDHPHALSNYQARGFSIYETRTDNQ